MSDIVTASGSKDTLSWSVKGFSRKLSTPPQFLHPLLDDRALAGTPHTYDLEYRAFHLVLLLVDLEGPSGRFSERRFGRHLATGVRRRHLGLALPLQQPHRIEDDKQRAALVEQQAANQAEVAGECGGHHELS